MADAAEKPKKVPKSDKKQQQIDELTADLQRTRADFENYRNRSAQEKSRAVQSGAASAILKLIPVIDTIERAITHLPDHLREDAWALGVAGVVKQLDKQLESLDLKRINATPGVPFDPAFHEAIQFDEDADGENEVIAQELQAGYILNGTVIRHAMVKVTRQ